jgi:hemoglobin
MLRLSRLVSILSLGTALAGCSNMQQQSPSGTPTLYERLGGLKAIQMVVNDFVGVVAEDGRINNRFSKTDIPKLKQRLVEQVCQGTGGPCTYQGKDMVAAHKGMNITDGEFGALVEDLIKALDKNKVPEKEKSELLGVLAPMKPAIVGQ